MARTGSWYYGKGGKPQWERPEYWSRVINPGPVGQRSSTKLPFHHAAGGPGASGFLTAYLATSKHLSRLLRNRNYIGSGAIAAANQAHRNIVYDVMRAVWLQYNQDRRSHPSGRDARRSARLMERYLNPESAENSPTPFVAHIDPSAGGFELNYERLDLRVVSPDGYPYWRSVEYGYNPFVMEGLYFTGRDWPAGGNRAGGKWHRAMHSRIGKDPRFPQFRGGAEIPNRGFKGYGSIRAGMRAKMANLPQRYHLELKDLPEPLNVIAGAMGKGKIGLDINRRPFELEGGRRVAYTGGQFHGYVPG